MINSSIEKELLTFPTNRFNFKLLSNNSNPLKSFIIDNNYGLGTDNGNHSKSPDNTINIRVFNITHGKSSFTLQNPLGKLIVMFCYQNYLVWFV